MANFVKELIKMKRKNLLPYFNTIISAAGLIGINTFLHPCRGEMAMKCVRTTHIASAVIAVIIAVNLIEAIIKNDIARKTSSVISVLLSAALFFVPLLGHCGGAMMHCNTHTMPAIRISALLLIVISVIAVITESVSAVRTKVHEND